MPSVCERFIYKSKMQYERQLFAFFMNHRNYPHPVKSIRHHETHISHVFLAGDFAYKLKKPVKFSFLDASTSHLRKKWCHLEVRLNRRLAPHMYLGVIPISRTRDGFCFGKRGKILDWVVQMRRLPEGLMLDRLISEDHISLNDIRRLITRLVPFFDPLRRMTLVDKYGMPARVRSTVFKNLSECRPFIPKLLKETDWQFLDEAYRQYLGLYEPLFYRRVKERYIIDGHGDLRCENICLTKPITIFDCVEFEPAFRRGDVANDLGFLLMDLEARGREDLSRTALDTYTTQTKDKDFVNLVPFYKCHRSLVRGKVRALEWLQQQHSSRGLHARTLARRHFRLALKYAHQFAPPRLIIVGGLIGTGKSTLAKHLAKQLGATLLRTDEIRLKEFVSSQTQVGFDQGRYSSSVSQKVYQRICQHAKLLLQGGHSVVCDGTFSKNKWRMALYRIAHRRNASFYFFECVIPRRFAMRRVAARYVARADLSEAQPEYYDRLRSRFEPVKGFSKREYTRLFTIRSPHKVFRTALQFLQRVSKID